MILWTQMLARVRRQCKDESAAVFTDATVQSVIVDAVRELARRRPEARLDKNGTIRATPWEWPNDPGAKMPIDDYYEEAVMAISLSKLYLRDAGDAKDESLGSYWQRRATELIGG